MEEITRAGIWKLLAVVSLDKVMTDTSIVKYKYCESNLLESVLRFRLIITPKHVRVTFSLFSGMQEAPTEANVLNFDVMVIYMADLITNRRILQCYESHNFLNISNSHRLTCTIDVLSTLASCISFLSVSFCTCGECRSSRPKPTCSAVALYDVMT